MGAGGGKKGGQEPTIPTYYAGIHFVICHGPVDKVNKILVDERVAWEGSSTGGNITIDAPELFGGKSREGGITGVVSLDFGGLTQEPNAYLTSKLGEVPAYRRVFSMILNQCYLGNNYYLKPWAVEAQRIHVQDEGIEQWYDGVAEISSQYYLNFSSITWEVMTEEGKEGTFEAIIHTYKGHGVTIATQVTVSGATEEIYNQTFYPLTVTENTIRYSLPHEPDDIADGNIKVGVYIGGLMNAVHIVRECLTNKTWGYGYLESDIDDTSFAEAALTTYNEGLGFSFFWEDKEGLDNFIVEVLQHIQGNLYRDRKDDKFHLTLMRKLESTEGLLTISPSNARQVDNLSKKSLNDLGCIYTVKYADNYTGKTNSTTVHNMALYQRQGIPISKSKTYSGVADLGVAHKIAVRDLVEVSTAVYSCTIQCNREAEDLHKGDAFVLSWPDKLDNDLVMRVVTIDLGTPESREITIECMQDIFQAANTSLATYTQSKWVNPVSTPVAATLRNIFEVPYYMVALRLGDSGAQGLEDTTSYIGASAGAPVPDSASAGIWTTTGTDYTRRSILDFCFTAKLLNPCNQTATSITITSIQEIESLDLDHFIQVGDEFMQVTNIAGATLTVVRGVLDTIPVNHLADELIFGIQDFSSTDGVAYLIGETVKVYLTPITPEGELPISQAPYDSITVVGRMHMPYPPGNFKINGTYWPATVSLIDLTLTWATRNRLQQTAGLIDYYTGDITSEVGVTYAGDLRRTDTSAVLLSFTGETSTTKVLDTLVSLPGSVTSITHTTTTAYATMTDPHLMATGDMVKISGATPSQYNGDFEITVTGGSTFTYVMTSDPGADASGSPVASKNLYDGEVILDVWSERDTFESFQHVEHIFNLH